MDEKQELARLRNFFRQNSTAELALGTADADPKRGRTAGPVTIPYASRSAHMHVIGRTRSGKSRFLADLIRQDILQGNGVCLLDPHGELYDLTTNWLTQKERLVSQRKIHAVRFTDESTSFRYNPLRIEKQSDAYTVSTNVTSAINRIYGGKSEHETPLIGYVLDVVCTILALRELPLAAAQFFLQDTPETRLIREKISDGVPNEYFKQLGLELSRLTPREFRETVAGAKRRMHDFLRNPAVSRIFSVTDNTVDLKQAMDDSHVLLFNTSDEGGLIDFKELRTIGMMLTNNLFAAARKRPASPKPTPFMFYIDEVQNYVSVDIERILSQAAKRGLYLTLGHQFLAQLSTEDPLIYNGVMAGTLLKAVFQLHVEDADVFVDELFANRIDFERVKERILTPHVIGHEVWRPKSISKGTGTSATTGTAHALGKSRGISNSTAQGEVETESWTDSVGHSDSSAIARGISGGTSESAYMPDNPAMGALGVTQGMSSGSSEVDVSGTTSSFMTAHGMAMTRSYVSAHGTSEGESEANSTSQGFGTSTSETEGEAEALRPIIAMMATQTMSLEDQRYELKRTLAFQAERHGYFALRRSGTRGFTTREVPDPLHLPIGEANLREYIITHSPWISPADEVKDIKEHPTLKAILKEQADRPATPEPERYDEPDPAPPGQPG